MSRAPRLLDSCTARPARRDLHAQAGLTLVELMISITLGMFVVGAATVLLLSVKSSYLAEDDTAHLLDGGRYAIENITRAVRQAAYENLDGNNAPIDSLSTVTPNIQGVDARTYSTIPSSGLPATTSMSSHVSDILTLRFFGASKIVNGVSVADGTIFNCAGIATPAVATVAAAEADRGWSIFYVGSDASGEPALYCGYLDPNSTFKSNRLISGVESFQVLYGVDLDDNGIADRFVNATDLNALGAANWKKIVAVKVSLLIRGARMARADAETTTYDLFGTAYGVSSDKGTSLTENDPLDIPAAERSRNRKVFATTIQLRNRASGGNLEPL